MRLRIEISAKHKADAMEFYQLARGIDREMRLPAQRDGEWGVSCYADPDVIGDALHAIDPHLSRAFNAGDPSGATGRLRWEVR